jgi:hypothetical protein
MNPRNTIPARPTLPGDREKCGEDFTAPLGSATSGRLRFTNGARRVAVRADSDVRDLYLARFGERMPTVGVRGGLVTIRYPRFQAPDWLNYRSEHPAEVALNARIPWDIDVRGGASRFVADLSGLRLGSLSLDGGTSNIDMVLPTPSGNVAVVILGGASNVAISRPEGVAARLRLYGGATNLTFDDRRIGATGGELDLQSRGYEDAVGRYEIAVTGGANNMSIERHRGDREGADRDQEGE